MPSACRGWLRAAMSEGQLAVAGPTDDSRLAGMVGIASVILFAVAIFIVEAPPKIDDSALKVVAYFHEHDSAIRAQGYLFLLATAGAFLPAAGIRARLRNAGTSAVWTATWFGATIAVLSILVVQGGGFIALTIDPLVAGAPASSLLYHALIEMAPYSSSAVGISMAALAWGRCATARSRGRSGSTRPRLRSTRSSRASA